MGICSWGYSTSGGAGDQRKKGLIFVAESANQRILKALRSLAESLGGEGVQNVSVDAKGMIAEYLENIAALVANGAISGGSGSDSGGGGGDIDSNVIILHMDDSMVLDATAGEIYEALESDHVVVVRGELDGTPAYMMVTGYYEDDGAYTFTSGFTNFTADGADAYPAGSQPK